MRHPTTSTQFRLEVQEEDMVTKKKLFRANVLKMQTFVSGNVHLTDNESQLQEGSPKKRQNK